MRTSPVNFQIQFGVDSVGATSFFPRIKNTIAPNGNEIEINHAPYGGANEAAPKSWKDNGAKLPWPVVQFTVNLPIPIKMKIIQSHFLFSILVRIQSTRANKVKSGIKTASASVKYCKRFFQPK
jgi:hypothetical protein